MLSQRSHYALRALLVLAVHGNGKPMRIAHIAREAKVSAKFLEVIMLKLRKAGLLKIYRGCNGGAVLGRAPEEISFADIVTVTDGSLALSGCASEISHTRCNDCYDEAYCEIRRALISARDATVDILKSYDLATVTRRMHETGHTDIDTCVSDLGSWQASKGQGSKRLPRNSLSENILTTVKGHRI